MRMEITNTTSFLWNTPFSLSIGITGYAGQTTSMEYFHGGDDEDRGDDLNWTLIDGTEATDNFQEVMKPSAKELRVRVENPSTALIVTLKRKV